MVLLAWLLACSLPSAPPPPTESWEDACVIGGTVEEDFQRGKAAATAGWRGEGQPAFRRALGYFNGVIRRDPRHVEAYRGRAACFGRLGRPERQLADYGAVNRPGPRSFLGLEEACRARCGLLGPVAGGMGEGSPGRPRSRTPIGGSAVGGDGSADGPGRTK